jgi:hypothetical protein
VNRATSGGLIIEQFSGIYCDSSALVIDPTSGSKGVVIGNGCVTNLNGSVVGIINRPTRFAGEAIDYLAIIPENCRPAVVIDSCAMVGFSLLKTAIIQGECANIVDATPLR